MEDTNETIRQQFSERLKKELIRAGLPVSSPTKMTNEFNRLYPAHKMAAQTMRKWLFAEAMPTQAKLLALADMLGVSPQWLRFGLGRRNATKASGAAHDDAAVQTGVLVVAERQVALVPVVELLTRLSPSNVRLVENIVRCVLAEQDAKH